MGSFATGARWQQVWGAPNHLLLAANYLAFVKLAAIRIWVLDAKKPGLSSEAGPFLAVEKLDQPRVRERIMKLS